MKRFFSRDTAFLVLDVLTRNMRWNAQDGSQQGIYFTTALIWLEGLREIAPRLMRDTLFRGDNSIRHSTKE